MSPSMLPNHDNAHFNPLPPHGGRPGYSYNTFSVFLFQSTPSAWRETTDSCYFPVVGTFQSTPSAWRETYYRLTCKGSIEFQSTPSAWRETANLPRTISEHSISIHSLRMEGDFQFCRKIVKNYISIHSLRMEGDYADCHIFLLSDISIHSLRMEGDQLCISFRKWKNYFNPLPPHGGRRCPLWKRWMKREFQSTPSAWRETLRCCG